MEYRGKKYIYMYLIIVTPLCFFSDCKLQNDESIELDTQFVSNCVQGETKMPQPNTRGGAMHYIYGS